jgi:heat shock protein HslJ
MRRAWMIGFAILLMACTDKKPVTNGAAGSATPAVTTAAATSAATTIDLAGTEWRLEDLGGTGIIDNSQATLAFPEAGRVAGNGSCNRFMGQVTITGSTIKMGPLAGTRMACASEAVGNQEAKYLKALEGATRYEWKDPYLLIYSDGLEKPMRFSKGAGK